MASGATALLVSEDENLLQELGETLKQLGVESDLARGYRQAQTLLDQPNPPELVFIGATLPDGTWLEMVSCTARARVPIPAIVVSRVADHKIYSKAMQGGAADFIMPPFSAASVACVIRRVRGKTGRLGVATCALGEISP